MDSNTAHKLRENMTTDLLSVDVETVKLFTMPQILRDWLIPEPFVRLSLFANAMLAQYTLNVNQALNTAFYNVSIVVNNYIMGWKL